MNELVDVITTGLIMIGYGLLFAGAMQLIEYISYLLSNRNR